MADTRDRSLGERLNTWVQIIGIIGAGLWGAYTFVYKEITLPKSAPINISMNLQLKKVGRGNGKNQLVAVEMSVSAANPSSRRVYLLPSAWIVFGNKLTAPADESPETFRTLAAKAMNEQGGNYLQTHSAVGLSSIVAGGSLFTDTWLNPGETASRTVILYIPQHEYDVLDAHTEIPSTTVTGQVKLEWNLDEKGNMHSILYRVSKSGSPQPIKQLPGGGYTDEGVGFQYTRSTAQLSLWE